MKHYCNVTFLSIGDLGPDGHPIERLLRCSRCQETYYCSPVQQRSHWKIHKKVCTPQDLQEEDFQVYNMGDLSLFFLTMIVDANWAREWPIRRHPIRPGARNRCFRFLLLRLQNLCYGNRDYFPSERDEKVSRTALNAIMDLLLADNGMMDLFWAIPGILTCSILISFRILCATENCRVLYQRRKKWNSKVSIHHSRFKRTLQHLSALSCTLQSCKNGVKFARRKHL